MLRTLAASLGAIYFCIRSLDSGNFSMLTMIRTLVWLRVVVRRSETYLSARGRFGVAACE